MPDPEHLASDHAFRAQRYSLRTNVGGNDITEAPTLDVIEAPTLTFFSEPVSAGKDISSVCVVIPALNEAENLPHVLPQIPASYEVVIVDGGSSDDTKQVALELRPTVRIIEQNRRGKGNALACGFAAARSQVIVMLDADGSARVSEIPAFLEALAAGADFAKGSRFLPGGGSADITRLRGLGNRGLGALVNLLFRTHYTDLCYGYNAFWSYCLPALQIDADGFEVETQLNIRACKAGLAVTEVPSYEDERIYGVSNLNAWRDGKRVLRTILRERFGRRRRQLLPQLEPSLKKAK